ncbi:hypothetical protein WMY93_011046 [Mugilogobius chulae]|uniref:Uncharacterized protein n=1 Tax=Mugilogobius chulae TaxID=88201 RepID=A0AAW0P936_9GOBI
MAGASTFYLLLLLPLCTLQSEGQINPHEAQAAPPSPAHLRNLFDHNQNPHVNTKSNQADNTKVGLFIAASIGIFALMMAVYCIYNRFYTKQQYEHTQLTDDPDFPSDLSDPPTVFFHGSTFSSASDVRKSGYGSLSDSPSIISVPPACLLPPVPCPSHLPSSPLTLSGPSQHVTCRRAASDCIKGAHNTSLGTTSVLDL